MCGYLFIVFEILLLEGRLKQTRILLFLKYYVWLSLYVHVKFHMYYVCMCCKNKFESTVAKHGIQLVSMEELQS
jgi:hypothetical protein